MATDIEESDTEDHERPGPPKRQCLKIININNDNDGQSVNVIKYIFFHFSIQS